MAKPKAEIQPSMLTPFDLSTLLKPIAGGAPSGASVRYEGSYDAIASARREDEDLPRGIWEINLKKAQWDQVEKLCVQVLTTQSKDLQVAAWLAESWICLYGVEGLTRGVTLLSQLCDKFWPTLHPQLEENDHEFRLSTLEWVNEKLAERLISIPVTQPKDIGGQSYFWADVVSAGVLELQAKRHPDGRKLITQAHEEGSPIMDKIVISAQQTPQAFFAQLFGQLEKAQQAILTLEDVLHRCYPNHPHSFYKIRNILTEVGRFLKLYYTPPVAVSQVLDVVVDQPEEQKESAPKKEKVMEKSKSMPASLTEVTTREQAYSLLNLAADFLLATEPHSPTPYVVKRAVAWGHMSLAELYQEILSDEKDLAGLRQLLGVGLVMPLPEPPSQ